MLAILGGTESSREPFSGTEIMKTDHATSSHSAAVGQVPSSREPGLSPAHFGGSYDDCHRSNVLYVAACPSHLQARLSIVARLEAVAEGKLRTPLLQVTPNHTSSHNKSSVDPDVDLHACQSADPFDTHSSSAPRHSRQRRRDEYRRATDEQ